MPAAFRYSKIFFSLAFLLVFYLFYRMISPFLTSVILSLTLVSLFHANYLELNRRLGHRSNLSSALMCLIVTILIIIPFLLFSIALLNEFVLAYEGFQTQMTTGELGIDLALLENGFISEIQEQLSRFLGIEGLSFTLLISSLLERVAEYLLEHYTMILGGIGAFVLKFAIMLFSMFFFFRDGEALVAELKKLIPLAPEHEDLLLSKLKEVVYATFLGIFTTGICQGIVAGFIFYFLGISNSILWGTATAMFSMVPVLGTATVWIPLSLYLLLSGAYWKGITLLILGVTVIGLIDNLIRPLIIEGTMEGMHLLMVFFALAGGLLLFGPSGLMLGPLVAAMFITFLEIYKIEFREQLDSG
jgi:predicted PurR-regulated permease PerM